MNPQDGLENLLMAAHHIRHVLNRDDIRFVLIGSGSSFKNLKDLARNLALDDTVEFTGRLAPDDAMRVLAETDLCALPDPKNSFTDSCVMVKCLEYMALGKSFVAFDLTETRSLCEGVAIFVDSGDDPRRFADGILTLADDPVLRVRLGRAGRHRVEEEFAWSYSSTALLTAYAQVLNHATALDTGDVETIGTS